MLRRAQSVRHHPRPSLALGADDLGVLREGDESNEDVLRRQLLDKDRENDKARCVRVLDFGLAAHASCPTASDPSSIASPSLCFPNALF